MFILEKQKKKKEINNSFKNNMDFVLVSSRIAYQFISRCADILKNQKNVSYHPIALLAWKKNEFYNFIYEFPTAAGQNYQQEFLKNWSSYKKKIISSEKIPRYIE